MRFTNVLSKKFRIDDVAEMTKKFSNLPDRFIRRKMEQVYYRVPKAPNYLPNAKHERKEFYFSTNRPWTQEFYRENYPKTKTREVFLEPVDNWSHFLGDRVEILVGKDKGKQGFINQIIQERNWVFINGLNTILKEIRNEHGKGTGVYTQQELPLLVTTDVALVDPADLQATDFEWRYLEDGSHVRVSLRTGRVIPIPASAEATIDYKSKNTYVDAVKDTSPEAASAITYKPKLLTFEMELMEEFGIKEDRTAKKTYWY